MTRSEIQADLTVIGSGLAGTAAALAAKSSGQSVMVVSRGPGASILSSGALDLADDPLAVAGQPQLTCLDLNRNLKEVLLRHPRHPYHLLLDRSLNADLILNAIQPALAQLFPADGELQLESRLPQNCFAYTSLGTIKATAFAPQATARVGDPCLARPLLVGLEEFPDFDPGFWPRIAAPLSEKMGSPISGGLSAWIRISPADQLSSPETAKLLENPAHLERLIAAIRNQAKNIPGLSGVVLPPILPLRGRGRLLERLQEATGVPARELLSSPPSMPGLRLGRHLEDRLTKAGVRYIRGSVTGFETEGKSLRSLAVAGSGQTQTVSGSRFVLASGSFAGGGIRKGRSFQEPIFHLPVFCGDHAVGEINTAKLTHQLISKPHLLFTCGLKADASLRPLGPEGAPIFENLRAAGAVLQGSDPSRDGTGAGVAIATGWRAGTL